MKCAQNRLSDFLSKVAPLLVVLSLFLCGCNAGCNYALRQSTANIESVEVIFISPYKAASIEEQIDQASIVANINEAQWDGLFRDIKEMSCSVHVFDPIQSLTGNVVRIIYADGTFELIGAYTCAYYDGSAWQYQSHVVDESLFYTLLEKAAKTGDDSMS